MGVPDFLKFAARMSPTALCRIPKGGAAAPLAFDFVLVDATNACQTVGLDALAAFLTQPQLKVRRAVVFAMDAQRHRAGTSRSHRTHAAVMDADVAVQQLCSDLQRHYRRAAGGGGEEPQILISGRHVAGEADYKILDIQRRLLMQAFAAKEELPVFCIISEDSDVLCGALCGPAPHTVTIATKLHDTMFEMCVLRLSHVLAYIAQCVDALTDNEEGAEEAQEKQQQQQPQLRIEAEETKRETREEEQSFHRRKQDGPMIATGTRVVLNDSDSDCGDNEEEKEKEKEKEKEEEGKKGDKSMKSIPSPIPTTVTAQHLAEAEILQSGCVDLVFLFVVVMGNGGNIPPVVRGATKVDIQSCWKAYCRMKYDTAEFGREKEMGRSLLCLHDVVARPEQQSSDIASIVVDCSFLRAILGYAHYADAQSRSSVEEEKERAFLFLSQAVYTTLRYIVACNVHLNSALESTLLDARLLMETEVAAPSLTAFLWVLGLTKKKTLYFPLVGLANEAVLSNAPKGISAVESAISAERARNKKTTQNIVLEWDAGNSLVASGSEMSRKVRLQNLLPRAMANGRKNIVSCINDCVDEEVKTSGDHDSVRQGNKSALFSRLVVAWKYTMASFMPALRSIVRKENSMSLLKEKDNRDNNNTAGGEPGGATCGKRSNSAGSMPATWSENTKLSYSFELRRMSPVLVKGGEGEKEGSSSTPGSAALLKALRVSYDYTQPVAVPADVIKGDVSSLTAAERKTKRSHSAAGNDAPFRAKKQRTEGKLGKYRRPGKKERQRVKMANEKN